MTISILICYIFMLIIILMAMNERQLKSDNMYKDLYNILDKWYKQDKQ